MKLINKSIVIAALILAAVCQLQAIRVNPASGPYTVGQTIYFSGSSMVWDYDFSNPRIAFGDGEYSYDISYSNAVPHQYRQAGVYNLVLSGTSQQVYPEYLTITVTDERRITYTPASPLAGQPITFTAENFATPDSIRWDFGDGTVINRNGTGSADSAGQQVTYTYTRHGSFTVKAYDWNGSADMVPVSLRISIGAPAREITASILTPREDQEVTLTAVNFISKVIDWNFGDGQTVNSGSAQQTHRFMTAGQLTVSALDRDYADTPTTLALTILPENRSITAKPDSILINQSITFSAILFRGRGVLWDFGDGTQLIGAHQEVHIFTRPGKYTVNARDESGKSQRNFSTEIEVKGITDQVSLHNAELRFDNGRAYRVVAKNSNHLQAELQLKMEGTGLVTGIWLLDNQPFKQFSQLANQGIVTIIQSGLTPPLPAIDPGLHKLTVQLTRPFSGQLPEIYYYVEPISALMEIIEPAEKLLVKEDNPLFFRWQPVRGASWYEIGFCDSLFTFLFARDRVQWQTIREGSQYKPDASTWSSLRRNQPVFWQVRAVDSTHQLISQSEPREIQLTLNPAKIAIDSVSDLAGRPQPVPAVNLPRQLLVKGSISYPESSQYLMLRVFADERMVNQLLFRDIHPDKPIPFTSSVPGQGSHRITLQVLKPTSPAVVIGVHHIELTR